MEQEKFTRWGCTLYLENCLEGIKKIETGSIKCVVTDPPYFLGLSHANIVPQREDLNIADPFYEQLFKEIKRVLKVDGSIYWFTDWRGYPYYVEKMEEVFKTDNMLVRDKGNGPGNFYTNEHELIIFHTNNRHFRVKGARNIIRGIKSFASGAKATNGEKVHPTQKPKELIEKLIQDSTEEGDTVLDCFMGSGTTAVSCVETGRDFVGFEIQKKYFEIAKERTVGAFEKRGD